MGEFLNFYGRMCVYVVIYRGKDKAQRNIVKLVGRCGL